jgi:hypothetical protein
MTQLVGILRALKKEHARLSKQIQGISAALSAFGAAYGKPTKRGRTVTAEARARMAAAQRLRWKKVKSTDGSKKRKAMSAAARKKISLAQKARWAAQKKAS